MMQSFLKGFRRKTGSLRNRLTRSEYKRKRASHPERALDWLRNNELGTGGIRVHHTHKNAYPEVSGYLIPTLLHYGEISLADRVADWLLCIQLANGSFTDPTKGIPHVFDTAQVLRGLLVSALQNPAAREAAQRAADYLCSQMFDEGRGGFGSQYQGEIPESVLLYALPPLVQAAEQLNQPAYRQAADRCKAYYLDQPDTLNLDALTHFLAYEIEALIQLGEWERAKEIMAQVKTLQRSDGSVRGQGGVDWVCSTGLAQLAICWYRLGDDESADKAMAWLDSHQDPSGGFLGSYGVGASYFPIQQIAWAVKFYLDAHLLRREAYFKRNPLPHPDGETLNQILQELTPNASLLHWGDQNGTLQTLQAETTLSCFITEDQSKNSYTSRPELENQWIDVSAAWPGKQDRRFDAVVEIDTLPFSAAPEAVVDRMVEHLLDGGWLYLLEAMAPQPWQMPTWAHVPEEKRLRRVLDRYCDHVSRKLLHGHYVLWCGQKRSRLSGSEWNSVLINEDSKKAILENLRANRTTAWCREILLNTRPGDRVLEIGSGTGEISLQLARTGRDVTVLDISEESLVFTQECAGEMDIEIKTACADAMKPLPFKDNAFDCVWNSGLLEHFYTPDRHAMLREWSRVTSGTLITLVPNGSCLAYRMGKSLLEASGKWRYGLELPLLTLRDDYEAAGLRVLREYSIAVEHALNFLPKDSDLRRNLELWSRHSQSADGANQGYLLVTIGTKL